MQTHYSNIDDREGTREAIEVSQLSCQALRSGLGFGVESLGFASESPPMLGLTGCLRPYPASKKSLDRGIIVEWLCAFTWASIQLDYDLATKLTTQLDHTSNSRVCV